MAFKTITVDVEAYELLRSRKRKGQSFSAVIKEGLKRQPTGRDLLAALEGTTLEAETLAAMDMVVASRRRSSARARKL